MMSYYTEALEASPLDVLLPDDLFTTLEYGDRHLFARTRRNAPGCTDQCAFLSLV